MYHGEIFCPVITEEEQFNENGLSLGIQPVNPHRIVADRHGLRLSDRTACPVLDRPLSPDIEYFYATGTAEQFEAADADPEVGVVWWEEVQNAEETTATA